MTPSDPTPRPARAVPAARPARGPDPADAPALSHVRGDGSAHMVDVTAKATTAREAEARGLVRTRPDVLARILDGALPKGEVIPLARVAGIMGAKRTADLVPLCHPLSLGGVEVEIRAVDAALEIVARVRTAGPTGVEMEALTAVSVAALTVYDMIKAVDRAAVITDVRVTAKSGGRSGDWRREEDVPDPAAASVPRDGAVRGGETA